MDMIHIIGGGTTQVIRPHFSVCAEAYGTLAKEIALEFFLRGKGAAVEVHLTKMAVGDGSPSPSDRMGLFKGRGMRTNEDVSKLMDYLYDQASTKVVFLTAALCDWDVDSIAVETETSEGYLETGPPPGGEEPGQDKPRLHSRDQDVVTVHFTPAMKVIAGRKEQCPDVYLVACKTTTCDTEVEMYEAGKRLLEETPCDLVLVNDIHRRVNLVVNKDGLQTCTEDRLAAIRVLVGCTEDRLAAIRVLVGCV